MIKVFKHTKLSELFTKREEISKEINAIVDKMTELDAERNKLAIKMQKSKEKMIPIIEKDIIAQLELGEFEEVGKITKIDGGVEVEVIDKVEEFKTAYKEQKSKQKENAK